MTKTKLKARRLADRSKPTTSKKRLRAASGAGARRTKKPARAVDPLRAPNIRPSKQIRTFRTALDFLNSRTNFERRPPANKAEARRLLTLNRMKRLLADLGNPQRAYKSVHIGGTKGKGSTAAMVANMLQGAGMRVGLYTSPHVIDIRERICVNNERISESAFTRIMAQLATLAGRYKEEAPTFFELITAAAFVYFREKKVDIAVVEVGLGGRFDATNVLRPEVCGITSINLDHTAMLGNTLEEIAEEKAGIFKEHVPVVSAPQTRGVRQVLRKAADRTRAPLLFAGTEPGDQIEFSYRFESSHTGGPQARICVTTPTSHFDHLPVPLLGEHQAVNCGVAIGIMDQLKAKGMVIDDEKAIAALAHVRLPGRTQMICERPRVLVDVAHNAASVEALMRTIGQNVACETMVVIFGCCTDKDVDGMLQQLQLGADKVIFTGIKNPRSADPAELAARFIEVSGFSRMAQVAPNLSEALEIAQKATGRDDLICITGSFYLVSEACRFFANHPHRASSSSN